jgi:sugar/nucleoside kinase (ribokinase family)
MPSIFRRAKALGVTTSLDSNWDPADRWQGQLTQILPNTDVFMPNDQEAQRIYQQMTAEPAPDCLNSFTTPARYFLNQGVQCVTIKAGKRGAWVYTYDQQLRGQVEPVAGGDSIGAGDSFDAGFLAGWLRGYSLEQSLSISLACGRSVAAQVGGLAGQPKWEEVMNQKGG